MIWTLIVFFTANPTNITRNSTDRVFIHHSYTNIRKHCFSNRVAPLWNKLPCHIKKAPNINNFKNLIDDQVWIKLYEYDS